MSLTIVPVNQCRSIAVHKKRQVSRVGPRTNIRHIYHGDHKPPEIPWTSIIALVDVEVSFDMCMVTEMIKKDKHERTMTLNLGISIK
jgi:hypothetical protein